MGAVIQYRSMPDIQSVFCLFIYINVPHDISSRAVSINKPIASDLIKMKPFRRTMYLEKCFVSLLDTLPDNPVIKDIDVMFNPDYQVDVLRLLISAYKHKPFSLIWPGYYADNKLSYSEEGYPDYKVYDINDYDIMCVV